MRSIFANAGARLVRVLPPEAAHQATIKALAAGLGPVTGKMASARLAINVAGINFPNPLGLAAGFDKNAETPAQMLRAGFGFVEVGAVTPLAQPGNDKPRVFRLTQDRAVINRYGFNNDGIDIVAERLRRRKKNGVVGVNLGANKDSEDRIEDYVLGVEKLSGLVDFYTVNISSPNTPGLRALQGKASLRELIDRVAAARRAFAKDTPVFLKIAPDLTDQDKSDIASVLLETALDGLIVSNTTVDRPASLIGRSASEKGGLSGKPLFAPSTKLLREFRHTIGDAKPLIGVGGISSAEDAYEKIRSGASLVQLYTALIYEGPMLIPHIVKGLDRLLKQDGFENIRDAIGAAV